ncbi:MAG: hypothetical protein JRI57_00380 [Deltaproteobacteria bacterium]|nr:hypothetical protein [Deltaproteobacteria bacterium]MBW1952705.1 hypothetical protein [Deltaproteobacteria bacterium]MBW1986295.1 hypothetical protein [Deltaproteobacteria bacterium]MBW2134336.1 hypothetical protein [Deltaproteobacteria bacterium]
MNLNLVLVLVSSLAGLAAGMWLMRILIRFHGRVRRIGKNIALIELPFLGSLETSWDHHPDGLNIPEVVEVLDKIKRFGRLLDFDMLLDYARHYQVTYLGLASDHPEHFWGPGHLACSTLDWGPDGGYKVYLNPALNLEDTAARLSQELGLKLGPKEVQPFLFLHEIGHTRRSGNTCLISAAINSALSGGRRTHRRRRELKRLRDQVEKYADDFAVRELRKWRAVQKNRSWGRQPTITVSLGSGDSFELV